MASPLLIAKNADKELALLPSLANRHGLVTGATGTGKTVTLQALAQRFSAIGVPVFMADVKGDLSGLAKPGGGNAKVAQRLKEMNLVQEPAACPVVFWDVYGKSGHPVRATVSDMGPLLLARLIGMVSGLGVIVGLLVAVGFVMEYVAWTTGVGAVALVRFGKPQPESPVVQTNSPLTPPV